MKQQIIDAGRKADLVGRLAAIDESVVERTKTKELRDDDVRSAFRAFLDKPLPSLDHYKFKGECLVVEVFCFVLKGNIINPTTESLVEDKFTFPLGKVLAVGDGSAYKVGDIVKLKDYETSTISNPMYEAWIANPYSKANVERVGKEPEPYLQNLWTMHGPKLFRINPLKQKLSSTDWLTFKFADAHIECTVDPHAVLAL